MAGKDVIGIMGPGESATSEDKRIAFETGKLVADMGFILLTGGRNCGVMDAAMQGAKKHSGLTLGILPGDTTAQMSEAVDIPVITGMGNARNIINILSSKVVIAIGKGPGTYSEISLSLKTGTPVIALNMPAEAVTMFQQIAKGKFKALAFFDAGTLKRMIEHAMDET